MADCSKTIQKGYEAFFTRCCLPSRAVAQLPNGVESGARPLAVAADICQPIALPDQQVKRRLIHLFIFVYFSISYLSFRRNITFVNEFSPIGVCGWADQADR